MKRRKTKKSPSAPPSPAWWTVGGPCAMAVTMLLFGAVLSSNADSPRASDAPARASTRPALSLADRSASDAARLAAHRGGWTLQFFMGCDESNLRPLVERLDGEEAFFLLPYPGQQGCYRACWGRFRDKQDAQRPRAYPEALQAVETTPWATPIAGVLP